MTNLQFAIPTLIIRVSPQDLRMMIDRIRHRRNSDCRPIRVGAVSYLNSKPLIEGLEALAPDAELVLDYPSRLADGLAAGRLDVALVPSIEAFSDPEYEIVSDACVASRGRVLSVKLFCRVLPGDIRTLALDEGSRTSAALARIMLEERYGVSPRIEPLPTGRTLDDTDADAVLLIGDRAIRADDGPFREVWDLGQEWLDWTGLPFVFAMWVTRSGTELGLVEDALAAARDLGEARAADIAAREAPRLGLSREMAEHYLTRNLHFRLGSAERSGLRLFYQLAAQHGLAPDGYEPAFRGRHAVAVGGGR
jgi:chorismate dehydratase